MRCCKVWLRAVYCPEMSFYELPTPDVDGVMAVWIFRRRAQNTKIGKKLAKNGPLDSNLQFSQKWLYISSLDKNTKILAKSNFNSSANVGPLMTNDGALESWHQEGLAFCHLAGGRRKYEKTLHMCWEQTDHRRDCWWRHTMVANAAAVEEIVHGQRWAYCLFGINP